MESLFRRHYRPLCLYALHYLGDADAAEDAVQESFAALWEKMSGGAQVAHPKSYLYAAVRNRCIDSLRQRHPERLEPSDADGPITDEEAAERSEIEARLWTAVEKLPEKRRQILLMSKRDGMKYSEIAEKLCISERTVRNQVSRALETLRADSEKIFSFKMVLFCLSFV